MWLISYYHSYGSLYDFLQRCTLDKYRMLTMCLTTASGLMHLHSDIRGVCVSNRFTALLAERVLVKHVWYIFADPL